MNLQSPTVTAKADRGAQRVSVSSKETAAVGFAAAHDAAGVPAEAGAAAAGVQLSEQESRSSSSSSSSSIVSTGRRGGPGCLCRCRCGVAYNSGRFSRCLGRPCSTQSLEQQQLQQQQQQMKQRKGAEMMPVQRLCCALG